MATATELIHERPVEYVPSEPEIPRQHVMELTPSGVAPLVILQGQLGIYREKGPFPASGYSIKGGMEFDPITEKLKCHECPPTTNSPKGGWFRSVPHHILRSHDITAREYRRKHYLRSTTPITSPADHARHVEHSARVGLVALGQPQRDRMAADQFYRAKVLKKARAERTGPQMSAETRNARMQCRDQISAFIKRFKVEHGRAPHLKELAEEGYHSATICYVFSLPDLKEVFSELDIARFHPRRIDDAILIDELRNFYVSKGRLPTRNDTKLGLIRNQSVFIRRFGSLEAAFEVAGLGLLYKRQRREYERNRASYLATARARREVS